VEPQTKEVTLQTHGLDTYKRTLADVMLPDGMNLNQELVKQAGAGGIEVCAMRYGAGRIRN